MLNLYTLLGCNTKEALVTLHHGGEKPGNHRQQNDTKHREREEQKTNKKIEKEKGKLYSFYLYSNLKTN